MAYQAFVQGTLHTTLTELVQDLVAMSDREESLK